MPTDYARTRHAAQSRLDKAVAMAAWCWDHDVPADALFDATPDQIAALARTVGHNPPRTGSTDTHELVCALVLVREARAAAHPDDPAAQRAHTPTCTCPGVTPGALPTPRRRSAP
jgi:hypothetical protein